MAIVGESGCGKSTFAKVLMGLEVATDGEVRHEGTDIGSIPVRERGAERIRSLQMVFQNPFDTLNPSHTIGWQIGRVIKRFGVESDRRKVRERVLHLLDTVKLPRDFYLRRPRQLSGGQKQRIGIARAFAGNPSLVIADEPVSSLDVSVAAAVTELLMEIQRENKTTLLFISHDLSVVRYLADRIGRHVPRPDHGAGHDEARVRPTLPSIHRSPALRHSDCRPRCYQARHSALRQSAERSRSPGRLPLQHPLPAAPRRDLRRIAPAPAG